MSAHPRAARRSLSAVAANPRDELARKLSAIAWQRIGGLRTIEIILMTKVLCPEGWHQLDVRDLYDAWNCSEVTDVGFPLCAFGCTWRDLHSCRV